MSASVTAPALSKRRYETPLGPEIAQVRRFDVLEYHQLIRAGVLSEDEPFELLEGWIVKKMPNDPVHAATVSIVANLIRVLLPPGFCVREQAPTTTSDSEPEPDVVVALGMLADYLDHHPTPAETVLVIEVANTSLSRDRGWKQHIYARASTPEYWIINLEARQIERFANPSGPTEEPAVRPHYRQHDVFSLGQSVPVPIEGLPSVPVADVFHQS